MFVETNGPAPPTKPRRKPAGSRSAAPKSRTSTPKSRSSTAKSRSALPKGARTKRKPAVVPLRRDAVGPLEARLGGRLAGIAPFPMGPLTLDRAELVEPPAPDASLVVYALHGPWREGRVAVSGGLVEALAAPLNGGRLPGPAATALLVELALDECFTLVEHETGPLSLAPAARIRCKAGVDRKAVRLNAALDADDATVGEITLWGCNAFGAVLADALSTRAATPRPPVLAGLPLPARMRLARIALPVVDARDLEPGDIVFADGTGGAALARMAGDGCGDARAQLLCAGFAIDLHLPGPGPGPRPGTGTGITQQRGPGGFAESLGGFARSLEGFAGGRVVSWRKEHAMNDTAPPDQTVDPDAGLPAIGIDSVEVVLDVEFAREGLTLEELSALQPGSILTFAHSADAPLVVRINGRPFAHCEAVSVGERAGVRIVSLLAPPPEAAGEAGEAPRTDG